MCILDSWFHTKSCNTYSLRKSLACWLNGMPSRYPPCCAEALHSHPWSAAQRHQEPCSHAGRLPQPEGTKWPWKKTLFALQRVRRKQNMVFNWWTSLPQSHELFQTYQWNLPFYAHFDHRWPHNPPSAPSPLEMRLSGLKPSCNTPSSRPIAAPALAGGSLRRADIFRPSRKPALVVQRVGGIADDKLHKQQLNPHLLLKEILGWTCPFCTLFLPRKTP